jgi:hypothetical protein
MGRHLHPTMTSIAPLRWCDLSPFHENALLRAFIFCTR